MDLYSKGNARKFSDTRNRPWDGWERALNSLQSTSTLKALDLGCGNGRFGKYLNKNQGVKYVGLDNSEELLEIAKNKLGDEGIEHELLNLNLDNSSWEIDDRNFDLVVAFGLLHHLTSLDNRKYLIEKAVEYLAKHGVLILTFWMFKENTNFLQKHIVKDLGRNDFILSFSGDAERFCHYSDKQEIDALIDMDGVELIDRFRSDGIGGEMNEYIVLKKE